MNTNEPKVLLTIKLEAGNSQEECRIHMKINEETYNNFTSIENVAKKISKRDWGNLSKAKRLESHFKDIMSDMCGISYHYEFI